MDALWRHDPTGIATGLRPQLELPQQVDQPTAIRLGLQSSLVSPRPDASSRRLPEGGERFDLRTPYFAPVVEIHLERRWLAQRWVLTRTEEARGRPRHRVESQVSCPKPYVSATGATPPLKSTRQVSRTRVRNQRRRTRPVIGFCDAPRHGSSARLCPRLHHRPAPQLQVDALERAGCYRVFTEAASGARSDRPVLEQVLDQLRPGDTLVVWKLDRLGRSLRHLVDTVTGLADRGIGFRSLQEAIDTTTPGGKLVFHVFAALAEFERDLIRERTAAARARGRRGGRPPVMTAHKLQVAKEMYHSGEYTVSAIATTLGVSRASIYRHLVSPGH
jgi:DNA invertase Pin-like site-specific DNA recombinase